MHRGIDFYAPQPPRVPEIVVERGPKDQRVPAYRSIKMLPVSSSGNDNRVARGEPDVPRRDRERHFDGTNLAPDQVRGLLFGRGEPGLILPSGLSLILNLPALYQHQDAPACRISID